MPSSQMQTVSAARSSAERRRSRLFRVGHSPRATSPAAALANRVSGNKQGASNARLSSMPNPCDENIFRLWVNSVANNVTRRAEADHDLTDLTVFSRHPEGRKILQPLDGSPDQRQRASCGLRVRILEKCSQSLDVRDGVAR